MHIQVQIMHLVNHFRRVPHRLCCPYRWQLARKRQVQIEIHWDICENRLGENRVAMGKQRGSARLACCVAQHLGRGTRNEARMLQHVLDAQFPGQPLGRYFCSGLDHALLPPFYFHIGPPGFLHPPLQTAFSYVIFM